MDDKYFFAVDLGATSGRTIIGRLSGGKVSLEELTRFPNNIIETGGHYYWDLLALYNEVIKGLRTAHDKGIAVTSIGIDTWGCDFVIIGADGRPLRAPLSYRDPHTFGVMESYFREAVDKNTVYAKTGIQFMNFNSLFQLYAMKREHDSAFEGASKVLFIPDALMYMLTGNAVCEYTVASTSQMLNPVTGDLDNELIESVGLDRTQFGTLTQPATIVGTLTEEVQKLTGMSAVPVIAVAGHDTASAVAAVPAKNEKFAYLSSGTWSLMGIETPHAIINERSQELNFTNEGGIDGTTRFLKNICGMWLYEQCRKEWPDAPKSHQELQQEAVRQPAFQSLINPDAPRFANPTSMVAAIQGYCRETGQHVPEGYAEICRCIFDSLALRYRQVLGWLKEFASFDIDTLHIIGGGSMNLFLDQFTANSCGVTVLAGPQEGTALGNVMLQARAAGCVGDVWQMRSIIADSIDLKRFEPQDTEEWNKAYEKFVKLTY